MWTWPNPCVNLQIQTRAGIDPQIHSSGTHPGPYLVASVMTQVARSSDGGGAIHDGFTRLLPPSAASIFTDELFYSEFVLPFSPMSMRPLSPCLYTAHSTLSSAADWDEQAPGRRCPPAGALMRGSVASHARPAPPGTHHTLVLRGQDLYVGFWHAPSNWSGVFDSWFYEAL
jgi:hypothetical protein